MKKSIKIALGSFFSMITIGHVLYFLSENFGLNMDIKNQVYLLISFVFFLAVSIVLFFFVPTKESYEKQNDPGKVFESNLKPLVKKDYVQKGKAQLDSELATYEYQRETNLKLALVKWIMILFFIGLFIFVGFFYA